MSARSGALSRVKTALPRGQLLPEEVWAGRHRAIVALLWAHAVGLVAFGALRGHGLVHSILEGSIVAAAALVAGREQLNRSARSLVATFGLLTASAILVHFSGGTIEAHFHFFVMVGLITLYQDWSAFLLAIGYVVIQHGAMGVIDPASVYNHPAAVANPWKWAAIHGVFVLGASATSIVIWKKNEELRDLAEESHRESQQAKEAILRITQSISHRAPLEQVFEQITEGARRLMGTKGEAAALMLLDESDPSIMNMAFATGLSPEVLAKSRSLPTGKGVAGRAIRENRLCVMNDYANQNAAQPPMVEAGVKIAMAAPVCEDKRPVGALVVGSFDPTRSYSEADQETLLTFAEHVSLALADARTVDEMREAQRAKDMFLALVSHELKTPLTVIMGVLQTIQLHGHALPEELRDELVTSATTRGQDLKRLIDRLLEGAKGELVSEKRDCYLPDVVAAATGGFEHTQRMAVGSVPALEVRLDGAGVGEILGVLLENGISHSPADTAILVDVEVVGEELKFSVSNDGSLPGDVSTLFQPFQRGSEARSSGVGLGLYIARRSAEAMGGTLEASSESGLVTFTLTLPCEPTEEPNLSRISA